MSKITQIDSNQVFDIHRDLSITTRRAEPGPPKRIDGMSMGIVSMNQSAPHGGEVHPDGDEILYVISGQIKVVGDSDLDHPLELTSGDACIISAGEWHQVLVLEPTQLIHITPGPNGDHRPQQ